MIRRITLRNIPTKLAEILEHEAAKTGLSLNRTVIRLLEKGTGLKETPGKAREHRDLGHLAGSWSEAEAAEFSAELAWQRQIGAQL